MENKAYSQAKSNLNSALDELEDIVEEAQLDHHIFLTKTTQIRRTLNAAKINLEVAEKSFQQPPTN